MRVWSMDAALSWSCPFAEKEVGIFRNEDNANDRRGLGRSPNTADSSAIPTRHLGRSKEFLRAYVSSKSVSDQEF